MTTRNFKFSVESRERMSRAAKRRCTPEWRARRAEYMRKQRTGKPLSESCKRNISISLKGRVFSKEWREKISKANKGRVRTQEERERMSLALTRVWHSRKGCPGRRGSHGTFYSKKNHEQIPYRSKLELVWYQKLERQTTIFKYHPEPIALPYLWNGGVHHYLPDLRIRYTNKTTELVEIKPEYLWTDPKNLAKWAAAREWCANRRIPTTFRVVGYEALIEESFR